MNTQTENVLCVYDDKGAFVAVVKRDSHGGKKIVHMTTEASIEDIAHLIDTKRIEA